MKYNTLFHRIITTGVLLLFSTLIFAQEKPNIVFIMCDDLNDYQGVFGGHPQAKTPNIDKLAKLGTRFTNAQSNIPVCQPSRNSLFTGVYPHDSQDFGWVPHFKQKVLKNNKTFVQVLHENGYKTLGSGKLLHKNEEEIWSEWGLNVKHNYGPFAFDGEKLSVHPDVPEPYRSIGPIDGSYGRLSDMGQIVEGWNKKPVKYNNDNDRDLLYDEKHAQWAVNQLKELAKAKDAEPFFLGVGFVRPHTPLHAPDKYFDMFPIDEIELDQWKPNDKDDTFFEEIMGKDKKGPKYYRQLVESYGGDRELAIKHFLQAYLACVAFVDDQIGKVVDQIEKSSLKNNTIIVFTADHGWQMGEKDYLFKNSPWEESCRIPMIIKSPKGKKGQAIAQPVSLIDVYPTILDYANIDASNKKSSEGAEIGGYSMKGFVDGGKKFEWQGPNGALSVVGVYGAYGKTYEVAAQNYSYRTENFRYIHYTNGEEELYDHSKDPYEWTNVAKDKKYAKELKQLRKEVNNIIGVNFQ
ncbi:sulfatase [Flammeovirga agarivorans]|uniref:Sulfatase n=1 Tax=Flammeovirga agarivorans TaxID=2726742 RepID=A0A7X8SKK0_9BACT|nr:sulfatase [Flammeovirga agarivorans]NLR91823.1 sulfatase [Flammeovirga agarivorans]